MREVLAFDPGQGTADKIAEAVQYGSMILENSEACSCDLTWGGCETRETGNEEGWKQLQQRFKNNYCPSKRSIRPVVGRSWFAIGGAGFTGLHHRYCVPAFAA